MNVSKFEKMNICDENAIEWLKKQENEKQAWNDCHRGDWMLYLISRKMKINSKKHKQLVYIACECARLALKYLRNNEKQPLRIIETAEKWTKDKTTLKKVKIAIDIIYTFYVNTHDISSNARDMAIYTAYEAGNAVLNVEDAYNSCHCAVLTHDVRDRDDMCKICANIVRKYFPKPPIIN